jgi:EAL domain-containing protein (putative c-di-GMP-specific phosphodiesterase class I)
MTEQKTTSTVKSSRRRFAKGMSLGSQLSILLVVLAILTFVSTLYASVGNMRSYLDAQLSRSALDTANSLGLSIAPYMGGADVTTGETMMLAIFDSGYYLSMEFRTSDKVLFSRQNPLHVDGVPAWFMQLFPLMPPAMKTEVNDGWRIAGVLTVQSHPGWAYLSLWSHTQAVFWTSLFICLLALMAVHVLLMFVLKPLKAIEQQANALSQKRFERLDTLPFTKELRSVVRALNHMVSNVQRNFDELTVRADKLSATVYLDALTGVANRSAFNQAYEMVHSSSNNDGNDAYMYLVSLPSLQVVNNNLGYAAGDNYLLKAVSLMQAQLKHTDEGQLFRISGSDFAIMARLGRESAESLLQNLIQTFALAATDDMPSGFATVSMITIAPQQSLTRSLQKLDLMRSHQQVSPSNGDVVPAEVAGHWSRQDWLELLHKFTHLVVSENRPVSGYQQLPMHDEFDAVFDLDVQPVVGANGKVLYMETFVRFKLNNHLLSSADVFAMAERLGVAQELDRAVVSYILNRLLSQKEMTFAINLSKTALQDQAFTQWLCQTIRVNQASLPPLLFEINEHAIVSAQAASNAFIQAVKQLGCKITVERFGSSFSSFRYLQGMDIDFIKIDGSYIKMLQQQETYFFVETMTTICHGIGITVLASHVEDADTVERCKKLHIDGLQGIGLATPASFLQLSQKYGFYFDKLQVNWV